MNCRAPRTARTRLRCSRRSFLGGGLLARLDPLQCRLYRVGLHACVAPGLLFLQGFAFQTAALFFLLLFLLQAALAKLEAKPGAIRPGVRFLRGANLALGGAVILHQRNAAGADRGTAAAF